MLKLKPILSSFQSNLLQFLLASMNNQVWKEHNFFIYEPIRDYLIPVDYTVFICTTKCISIR